MSLSLEEINQHIQDMDNETKALKEELLKMCWFMRGGLTISEAYQLDHSERMIISEIIKGNLETTKTSGLPFF